MVSDLFLRLILLLDISRLVKHLISNKISNNYKGYFNQTGLKHENELVAMFEFN